ncbi:MAG: hypothetical protein CMK59_06770 [Proteobacteria bacterium]|nr:hypothetical protein [Pseudomonadota bacterium]
MLFLISLAFAQNSQTTETEVIIPKVQEHDFEGVEIEGQLYKPGGFVIRERSETIFNPLINLREDFSIELKQSVSQIK